MFNKVWFFCMNVFALPIVVLIIGLNVIHPFIHGTFLDGGALDSSLLYLNFLACGLCGGKYTTEMKHLHKHA